MIEGEKFVSIIKTYFDFLITEFEFKLSEEIVINGNFFYSLEYINQSNAVTVAYENAEDYLTVYISLLENGEMPNYDDKTKTLHLNDLNQIILSKVDKIEFNLNNDFFSKFHATNEIERKLLKSAKELRLCLKHFNEL